MFIRASDWLSVSSFMSICGISIVYHRTRYIYESDYPHQRIRLSISVSPTMYICASVYIYLLVRLFIPVSPTMHKYQSAGYICLSVR